MSKYQYYELVAIDQPLSVDEQADLRAISTRALITPTSFVSHYERGDLKADPRRLVERYFGALLHLANRGTHRLVFRLPTEAFGSSAAAVSNRYLQLVLGESVDHRRGAECAGRWCWWWLWSA